MRLSNATDNNDARIDFLARGLRQRSETRQIGKFNYDKANNVLSHIL